MYIIGFLIINYMFYAQYSMKLSGLRVGTYIYIYVQAIYSMFIIK